MKLLRTLLVGTSRARSILGNNQIQVPMRSQRFYSEEPTFPFDNLPFTVRSRYTLTVVFTFLFGIGLWAPFFILWYSMAKRTM